MASTNLKQKSLSNISLGNAHAVYCLCRSSDCSTFMIACDSCNIWYHGSCIGISEKESAKIENFFCHRCRDKTPSLRIKYNIPQKEVEERLGKFIKKRLRKEIQLLDTSSGLLNVDNQQSTMTKNSEHHAGGNLDSLTCDDSTSNHSDSSSSSTNAIFRQHQLLHGNNYARPAAVQSVQYETLISRDEHEQSTKKNSESVSVGTSSNMPMTKRGPTTKNTGSVKRKREVSNSAPVIIKREPHSELDDEEDTKKLSSRRRRRTDENVARQCYGPSCVQEARPLSKYCSDKCGLELARNRLLQFLPMRLMQWQTIPSVADSLNKAAIDDIRKQIDEIKQRMVLLDEEQRKLDEIVERGKQLKATKDTEKTDTTNDETDWTCFCVLCNQEVNQKSYMRHIDKCFIRYESQVSYGSNVKSNIDGLFCDHFDATNQLYCKRLKIICPEHSRDPKIGPDEACGCPLEKNLFEESDQLCTNSKRTCARHFKWDRKRRAQIDLERLHELMRLEELVEKENRLSTALSERGSVAGLLLHKTTAH